MSVALVIDASCDLPLSLINEHDISVLPVSIFTNGRELLDWRHPDTTLSYYQEHLVDKGNEVTTQPVTTEEAIRLLSEGPLRKADYVLVQTTSRTRSETFDRLTEAAYELNVRLKREQPQRTVRVMDSHALFAGQGLIAAHTQALIRKGLEGSQLRRAAAVVADHTHTLVIPPDLYYIRERARQRGETSITLVRALLGRTLGITPIVCGYRDNHFPAAKFKGFAAAVEGAAAQILKQVDKKALRSPYVSISYAGDLTELTQFEGVGHLRERHQAGDIRLIISTMGLAGATYLGPGAMSMGVACDENEWSHPD
ncbi:MAG: DegV family protein [Natronospirillum sp.]|uniref:DegV family protein n=1 Tax=Natronospirillum sp. TaxID=2812955 RepID=UPI0025CB7FB6|nr:DegV family protein [Natronospirillum sp.]MCH8552355.1 DegV family protein [Natronospirillum sp.]